MSTTAISTAAEPIKRRASPRLPASPQTSRSGCWLIKFASHSRTSGWSSISRILAFLGIHFRHFALADGHGAGHPGAAVGQAFNSKSGANHAGPIGHDAQAHPIALAPIIGN